MQTTTITGGLTVLLLAGMALAQEGRTPPHWQPTEKTWRLDDLVVDPFGSPLVFTEMLREARRDDEMANAGTR